jgi:non-heme chloroperoxidase
MPEDKTTASTPSRSPSELQSVYPSLLWRSLLTRFSLSLSLFVFSTVSLFAQLGTAKPDKPKFEVQFVTIEPNVKLEVVDWGGSGRPLVFLAGLGLDAHEFDDFAPKFTHNYHVYGITRRGFGASSAPAPANDNYSADHLADDVLTVCTTLKIERPVLVGHSIAGQELSSIGSRFPDKVAALIYLDAAYSDAFYSPEVGNMILDAKDVKRELDSLFVAKLQDPSDFAHMESEVARLDRDLKTLQKKFALMPAPPPHPANAPEPPPILLAIVNGNKKFTSIRVPILAIFADPHDLGEAFKDNPTVRAALIANDQQTTSAQADAFQTGVPQARVVRIPNASHFVFRSNEKQVLAEMNALLSALPQ